MLIDEASICVAAGNGGDGKVAFYNNRGKPCGGDGAMGASVYARVKPSLTSLISYIEKKEHKGLPGGPGESFNRYGKKPEDLILYFPKGTQLTDVDTGEIIHLDSYHQDVLLCRGGKGGWGNTTINRKQNHIFSKAMTGQKGQIRHFQVYMKLIADCGLIGFPNAGKSSLLNALTRAQARVADYPFTTLEPNLGVLAIPRGDRIILADIPGLIEGASQGKGLGVKFLKHVRKCVSFCTVSVVKVTIHSLTMPIFVRSLKCTALLY
jgi:GTP-binding protein